MCGNGNAIGNAKKLPCCATWWWPEWSRGGAGAGALFGSDLGFSFRAESGNFFFFMVLGFWGNGNEEALKLGEGEVEV